MTVHGSSAIALYTGDARLWQDANVVEAPSIEFDRDHRSMVADGKAARDRTQPSRPSWSKPSAQQKALRKVDPDRHHFRSPHLRRQRAQEHISRETS